MKKHILILFVMLTLGSCNDDYLEKYPINSQTEVTAFKSNENFKTYSWGLYSIFTDGNHLFNFGGSNTNHNGDMFAAYLSKNGTSEPNNYRSGSITVPGSGNGWNFSFVRKVNLMLSNIEKSEMNEKDQNHWRSVGYFFRAYRYFELVSRFGDVPWVDKVLTDGEEDKEMVNGKRDPRKTVTDNILADLQFAELNIKTAGDGPTTINRDVVRALMSRFCLFEGTWRKNHELGDHQTFLDECIRVSELLAASYPTVADNYDALVNSADLKGHAGVIFYKRYEKDVISHSTSHNQRTTLAVFEMPKYSVEMYLCQDGKTISNSTQYDGDKNMYDEFRNRDLRLLYTVVPPYSMERNVKGGQNPPSFEILETANYNNRGFYTGSNGDGSLTDTKEYVELLKTLLPEVGSKRIPTFNWSGQMNWGSPNISGTANAPLSSRTGYSIWTYYDIWETNGGGNQNVSDRPIYWIEEVLLNLAEAKFEVGQFNQSVADATINKLRPRAKVAKMVVGDIDASFDPNRDPSVDAVLWEIRRERFVELMGHGFGWQDVRRWKKGEWYINRDQYGTYMEKTKYVTVSDKGLGTTTDAYKKLQLVDRNFKDVADNGYLKRFENPSKIAGGGGWDNKYYLYAIPSSQIVLNPNITQNMGW